MFLFSAASEKIGCSFNRVKIRHKINSLLIRVINCEAFSHFFIFYFLLMLLLSIFREPQFTFGASLCWDTMAYRRVSRASDVFTQRNKLQLKRKSKKRKSMEIRWHFWFELCQFHVLNPACFPNCGVSFDSQCGILRRVRPFYNALFFAVVSYLLMSSSFCSLVTFLIKQQYVIKVGKRN